MEAALAGRPAGRVASGAGGRRGALWAVSNVAEALSSEQAAARGLVIEVGGLPMPGNPMKLGGYPEFSPNPAPELGRQRSRPTAEFGV